MDAVEIWMPRKGSAHVLEARTTRLEPPGPGQVTVRIEAAGVAYADIAMRAGTYPGVKTPVVPGYDCVGRIVAVGHGVDGWAVGNRVAGVTVTGNYASARNVDAALLVPAPEGADAAKLVAATLNGLTAWQMLKRVTAPERGEWILVHGASGGVGTLLLDLARAAGIKAIGTSSARHRDVVARHGAEPIDYAAGDVLAQVRAISGGGVAAAYDHIGGRHFRNLTMAALRPGGVGVLYGAYDVSRGGRFRLGALLSLLAGGRYSPLALVGESKGIVTYLSDTMVRHRVETYRADMAAVFARVASGALDPVVGACLPLERAAEAQVMLENRAVTGKIVLLPDNGDRG